MESKLSLTRSLFVRANKDDEVLKTIDTNHATRSLRCLQGTRQDLIRLILEWTCNIAKSVFNILWIYGYPGVGKSTLTMHIAMLLRTMHQRLAVIIEFSRTTGIDRKSTRLNSSHSGESRMPSSA